MKQLLHFTATWCQPCKQMEPLITKLVSDNPNIDYTKIDVSDEFDDAVEYGVRGVPTFIAMIDGKEVGRHSGVATQDKLLSLFVEG
jgi:thioredoxin 1